MVFTVNHFIQLGTPFKCMAQYGPVLTFFFFFSFFFFFFFLISLFNRPCREAACPGRQARGRGAVTPYPHSLVCYDRPWRANSENLL